MDQYKATRAIIAIDSVVRVAFTLPWIVAYSALIPGADCDGLPLVFAKTALFTLAGIFIWVLISIPLNFKALKQIDIGIKSSVQKFVNMIGYAQAVLSIALWIFSCVAVTRADECRGGLMRLIWAYLLMPAIIVILALTILLITFVCGPCWLRRTELHSKGKGKGKGIEMVTSAEKRRTSE